MPELSVIVPVFNVEKVLTRCINSILSQTFKDFELILVNDGSTDRSGVICDKYAAKDKRIKVIHKSNGGVSSARNAALDLIQGEYYVFVDSDDTVDPEYLSALYSSGNADFVSAGFNEQAPDKVWRKRVFPAENPGIQEVKKFPSRYMGKYYFGYVWGRMFKREITEKYHIRFDVSFARGEDTLFIFQYMEHCKNVQLIPYSGYNYHHYDSSLSRKRQIEYWHWLITVEEAISSFFNPIDYNEQSYLDERIFKVLKTIIKENYRDLTMPELLKIYNNSLFDTGKSYAEKKGSFDDKVFLVAMKKGNYTLYDKYSKSKILVRRIKNKLKRMVKK